MEKNIGMRPTPEDEMASTEKGVVEEDPSLIESGMSDQMPISDDDLASESQVAELSEMMDKIEAKYRDMNAEIFASKNQGENIKRELVKDVFMSLQDAGIDLSDTEAIREFLDLLEDTNPDLYEMFINAFEGLFGEETPMEGQMETEAGMPMGDQGQPMMEQPMMEQPMMEQPAEMPGGMGSPDVSAPGMTPPTQGLPPTPPPQAPKKEDLARRFPNLSRR